MRDNMLCLQCFNITGVFNAVLIYILINLAIFFLIYTQLLVFVLSICRYMVVVNDFHLFSG